MDPQLVLMPDAMAAAPPPAAANEAFHGTRPRMVLAHADRAYAASVDRHFRRLGWEVRVAATADEARWLASQLAPAAVVLDADLPGQTGWLICESLTSEQPGLRVILVAPEVDRRRTRFAALVGALALVGKAADPTALVDQVYGTALAAAG